MTLSGSKEKKKKSHTLPTLCMGNHSHGENAKSKLSDLKDGGN